MAERPDSPCVGVCNNLFSDECQGCGRTITEIAEWVVYNEEEKDVIWQRITLLGYPKRKI